MLFPAPKIRNITKMLTFSGDIRINADGISDELKKSVSVVFSDISSDADVCLSYNTDPSLECYPEEAFSVAVSEDGGRFDVKISSYTDSGFMRALFFIKRMLMKKEVFIGSVTDYPSFSVRGYIEGFYGNPWKSDERPEMMELMALFGENTHYYAPKDDPYHRDKWNEPYPEKQLLQLKELVKKASELYVEFYYCIAPGLSMNYSSEEDFEALKGKTLQLFSAGIKNFGLLLDDIPSDLFYKEDKEKFRDAAEAHVYLVNKYFTYIKSLSPQCRLTVCPTAYHGKGSETELTSFAGNIPEEVSVFYTGSDICSKEITLEEAVTFFENTSHRPLYWDNYPVNDAEMFMEMHMGPIIGRDAELHKCCSGIISNCMEYFNCNKLPLITVAAYLWNSEEYDPEKAFSEAVSFLFSEDEREDIVLLCDHFRTSCLHDENSRIMGEYLSRAVMCRHSGDIAEAMEIIREYTQKIDAAAKRLALRTAPVYKELSRWIKKFCLMSDILNIAYDVLSGEDKKAELKEKMELYNECATVLTAFCFREYIESVLSDEN